MEKRHNLVQLYVFNIKSNSKRVSLNFKFSSLYYVLSNYNNNRMKNEYR